MLDLRDGFLAGQDAADGEETGLHNRIDAITHSGFISNIVRIDHIEVNLLVDQIALHLHRQCVPDLFWAVDSIEQEGSSLAGILEHVEAIDKTHLVAANKVSFAFVD